MPAQPGPALPWQASAAPELMSSRFIAILKVPSTITTTLAPTSSERIFAVMLEPSVPAVLLTSLGWSFDGSLGLSLAAAFLRAVLSLVGAAAAAWAARRAAAMKLDVLICSLGVALISPSASSEAAIRSDGEDIRGPGRVPGSSG